MLKDIKAYLHTINHSKTIVEEVREKKLRGGYYTPQPIANFISKWAIDRQDDLILEPSCGDGVFLESIINCMLAIGTEKQNIFKNIQAVEFDPKEANKAIKRVAKYNLDTSNLNIHYGDFFNYCKTNLTNRIQYDSVIGNPPFIRYQDFPEEQRTPAFALMKRAGLNPSRLTNAWIPFLVASSLLLKPKGKIGLVIPAELFQVNYAAETRLFLSEFYSKISIVTFRKLVFEGIQQEVVLVLAEKNGKDKHGIKVIELDDINDLKNIDLSKEKIDTKILDHSTEKWTQYYLNTKEIELLRKIKHDPSIPVSGEYIDVDVGIVTGQNKFFVLKDSDVKKYKIRRHTNKIVGRSSHLKGLYFENEDWENLVKMDHPTFLLSAPNINYKELPATIQKYIDYGESLGFNLGYKCRIRKNWWTVPSLWTPDAFMLRQVHGYPKIILNNCKATATDTLHRVKFINGIKGDILAPAFLNSLTFAFSEVTGRSYGGGVLTFEPSEAEKLPLPIKGAKNLDTKLIDKYLREKNINKILDINDKILLKDSLNFSDNEISVLRNIWEKLRNRRNKRRYSQNGKYKNQTVLPL